MENTIGVINISNEEEKFDYTLLAKKIRAHDCLVMELTEKNQLQNMDGLIINLQKDSDYLKVFQWLIDIQEEHSLFIWIFCANYSKDMDDLFLRLSKKSVIEVIEHSGGIERLSVLIKNAMAYKNYWKESLTLENSDKEHYLDSKKLSLVVSQNEIALTKTEFNLVSMMYEKFGEVVTYHEIGKNLFPNEKDMSVLTYRIANIIFRIREKLKEQTYFKVDIIRTSGYQLSSYQQKKIGRQKSERNLNGIESF